MMKIVCMIPGSFIFCLLKFCYIDSCALVIHSLLTSIFLKIMKYTFLATKLLSNIHHSEAEDSDNCHK